jgi:hypothetical protein
MKINVIVSDKLVDKWRLVVQVVEVKDDIILVKNGRWELRGMMPMAFDRRTCRSVLWPNTFRLEAQKGFPQPGLPSHKQVTGGLRRLNTYGLSMIQKIWAAKGYPRGSPVSSPT